jgi:hypothetical protein
MGGKVGIPELVLLIVIPVGIWIFGFVSGIAYAKRDKKS